MPGRPLLQAAKSHVWEIEDSQRPAAAAPENVEGHPKRYLNPYELRALAEDKKREEKQARERQDELIKSNLLASKSAASGTSRLTACTVGVKSAGSSSNQAVGNAAAASVIPSQKTQTDEIATDFIPKDIKTDEIEVDSIPHSEIITDKLATDSIPEDIKTDEVEVDSIPHSQIITDELATDSIAKDIKTDEIEVDSIPHGQIITDELATGFIPEDIKTDKIEVDSIPHSQVVTDEIKTDSTPKHNEIQIEEMAEHPTAPKHVVGAIPMDKNTGAGEGVMEVENHQHHILDEYQARLLRRAEQDSLYIDQGGRRRGRAPKVEGKGRGRGRGRGRAADKADKDDSHEADRKPAPRAKAKAKAKASAKASAKAKNTQPKSKSKKGKGVRKLFASDDETWQEDNEAGSRAAPKRKATAAKSGARKSKRNRDSQNEALAAGSAEPAAAAAGAPATPVRVESPAGHDLPPPAPERPSRKPGSKPEDAKKGKVPGFNHCQIVPYWSRQACGLKVRDDEGGLRQVFYVGVKGASMKEHLDLISEIAARLIFESVFFKTALSKKPASHTNTHTHTYFSSFTQTEINSTLGLHRSEAHMVDEAQTAERQDIKQHFTELKMSLRRHYTALHRDG